ncbi:hypothetical protein [Streptomyces sp. NBC_00212]|uniref:hypothetical protein n=1 Tax=Streptomyces sp. NBC_00212 TaxID=2975684 RepID=UPI003248EC1D
MEGPLAHLPPRIGDVDQQARVRGVEVPVVFTYGTAETLKDRPSVFNPPFLLDALDSFTGDSLTLHLPPTDDKKTTGPMLLTDGPEMAGQGCECARWWQWLVLGRGVRWWLWRRADCRAWGVTEPLTFHSRALPSATPAASRWPSVEKATA